MIRIIMKLITTIIIIIITIMIVIINVSFGKEPRLKIGKDLEKKRRREKRKTCAAWCTNSRAGAVQLAGCWLFWNR